MALGRGLKRKVAQGLLDYAKGYRGGPLSKYKKGRYFNIKKKPRKAWRSRAEIKQVINSMKETKRVDYSHTRQLMYHNGGVSVAPNVWPICTNANTIMWAPSQGDGDGNRDGNDIYVKGFTVRFMVNLPADRLNTKIRCLVVKVPRGYSVTNYTSVMDSITGNSQIDPVDKDRVKVIKQFFLAPNKVNPSNGATGKEATQYKKFFIPLNKVVKFEDDGTLANFLEWDYYMLAWAYDTYSTLPGDTVAYCQLWNRCSFKD